MIKYKYSAFASLSLLMISITSYAEEVDGAAGDSQEKQERTNIISRINSLIDSKAINKDLGTQAIEFIDNLLSQTRLDQDIIYNFSRTINKNVDSLGDDDLSRRVRKITRRLRLSSYSDDIFQNANLSNQLKTRLPLLVEDSLKLTTSSNGYLRGDFFDELQFVTDKYIGSRRFTAGFGLSYSYIPRIKYRGQAIIDFSPYQSVISGGPDRLLFNTEFSNKSFPSLLLSARVPYITLDALFPIYEETNTISTPVVYRDIDDTATDILMKSEIKSKLEIDYDINVKLSVSEVLLDAFDIDSGTQTDWGVGIGIIGYRIEDKVSTDIRFETDPSQTYNELPTGAVIQSEISRSFNSVYYSAYYNFNLSDEFVVGLNYKSYRDGSNKDTEVEIDRESISLNVVWYPTFPFL